MTSVYLDNAATTYPKPASVIREVSRCMSEYCGNPGRGSNRMALAAAEKLYECRCLAGELFGLPESENTVFTLNATHALNIAIKGLVPSGSHVIMSDMEHNSVLRPVEALRRTRGVTYSIFGTGQSEKSMLAEIEALMRPNTKALIVNHSSNIVNRTLPAAKIGAICEKHALIFILDASQSAGSADINMKRDKISALCMPGHKGLLGPQGSGMLLLGEGVLPEPLLEGGSGVNSADSMMPAFLPDRLEAGTMATPAIAGLCEGMKYVIRRTPQAIRESEAALYNTLYEALRNDNRLEIYTDSAPGALLLFNIKGMSAVKCAAELDRRGICTRAGLHCSPLAHAAVGTPDGGAVRASLGAFTSKRDISLFQQALYGVLHNM